MQRWDIPEAMISFQSRQMVDDFARRIMQAGYDDGTVLPVYRSFGRKMMEEFKPEGRENVSAQD